MNPAQISIKLIRAIFGCAQRIIGEDAVKLANEISGLEITPQGEIEVTGDGMKAYQQLLKAYQGKLHGTMLLDVDITVNVYRSISHDEQEK